MVRGRKSEQKYFFKLTRRSGRSFLILVSGLVLLWPLLVKSNASGTSINPSSPLFKDSVNNSARAFSTGTLYSPSVPVFRDSASVNAQAFVKHLAQVGQAKPFAFPDAVAGEDAFRIGPSDPRALSFSVSGEKRHTYYLQFPPSLVVPLAGDMSNDPDRYLHLEDLATSQAGQSLLPGDGAAGRASLGATRAQLRSSQRSGLYLGLLPVTVVYP